MTVEFFQIGGSVRDEIIGAPSHDIDFTCVAPSFEAMRQVIVASGMKIVQDKPEFFTIRAVARQPFMGFTGGLDFVWARKDGPSSDGRRPDFVEPGTLFQDQQRRDFTMNSVAKGIDGELIDPFGGVKDIESRRITCVGSAVARMNEDPLRALRALRFSVTLGFDLDPTVDNAIRVVSHRMDTVSKERQREEMEKMFAHDTIKAMLLMQRFPTLMGEVFSNGLRLSATMKG